MKYFHFLVFYVHYHRVKFIFDESTSITKTPSISSLFFPLYVSLAFFKLSLFSTTNIYNMLILNLKTTKLSEHNTLSPCHLNSDTDYSS